MKIQLKDFLGELHTVELPEGTKHAHGIIVSGDEVLLFPAYCDPMQRDRSVSFYEGPFYRIYEDGKWKTCETIPILEEDQP